MMRSSTSILSKPSSSSSINPTKKKKKSSKHRKEIAGIAAAYKEDLGSQGVKNKLGDKSANILPLAVTKAEKNQRLKRMARFGAVTSSSEEPRTLSSALSSSRNETDDSTSAKRQRRVTNSDGNDNVLTGKSQDDVMVGTSTALEKPYFRLTTFPKPENVRPQPILVKAMAHIKTCFIRDEDFDYANEQLKSVRQDITVQRLRNKFVLQVYETHARILLEHGDLDEFNQCQTMIRNLTTGNNDTSISSSPQGANEAKEVDSAEDDDGIHNCEELQDDSSRLPCLKQNVDATDEFRAYGLLYALVQNSWGELTRGLNDALEDDISPSTMSSSSSPKHRAAKQRDQPSSSIFSHGSAFRHAVRVVKAVMHHDYQAFFRLYDSAPHLSAYLMDFLVRRVREAAYERIIAAYRPTMSVEHFREALFFQDLEETRRFLQKSGAVFLRDDGVSKFFVDCKASASSSSSSPA